MKTAAIILILVIAGYCLCRYVVALLAMRWFGRQDP